MTGVTNPDTTDGGTSFDEVGDVLTYEFTVTNTGEVSFAAQVDVTDALIPTSPIACFVPNIDPASPDYNPDLIPGETATCTGEYTITQDDLDAGEVVNEAFAETEFGAGPTPVVSPPGTETTPGDPQPEISVVKSVATLPVTAVDQVLTYTLTITNDGNQTLENVVGSDPLLPGMTCAAASLAPGAELICSDTYTVLQDDIDAGEIINDAAVSALSPNGTPVEGEDQLITAMPASDPAMTMVKSATPDPFGAVDSGRDIYLCYGKHRQCDLV